MNDINTIPNTIPNTSSNTALTNPGRVSDDPRALFAAAVAVATPVIDATTPDHYANPTPCGTYNVRELLGHILFVVNRVASVGRREDAFSSHVETIDSTAWSQDWRSEVDEMVAAWTDDSRLDETVVLPWATMTGAQTLEMWASELTTHTWDLARATGQQPEWNPEVVSAAIASIHRDLPAADRTPMWNSFVESMPEGVPFDPPFGNAVPVAADADPIEQLVAWTGRRP